MARKKSIYSSKVRQATKYEYKHYKSKSRQAEWEKKIISTANKRLKRLSDSKMPSMALNKAGKNKTFSRKNKGDIYNAIQFLKNPTSTITGAKQYIRHYAESNNTSYEVVGLMIEQNELQADVVFTLSNAQYYGIIENYLSVEEVLKDDFNFETNVNADYEVQQGMSNAHILYVQLHNQLNTDYNFNVEI